LRGDDIGAKEDDAAAQRKAVRAAVIDGVGHWVDVRFE
jgi:hypothetical protein